MTAPESRDPKIVSYGDVINPDWSKELRFIFELRHGGHFTVEESDSPWTQAEIDAEWARQKAPTNVIQPSPAFVLNWEFKPEPEYHVVSDEEEDELLPFQYKPDPSKQIDWGAIRAQPHVLNVENSASYKNAVVNLKKRKSEEYLAVDTDAIKKKYEALQGKFLPF